MPNRNRQHLRDLSGRPAHALISCTEAARLISVFRQTISQAVTAGHIPARYIGPYTLVTKSDVLAYQKNRPSPGPAPKKAA